MAGPHVVVIGAGSYFFGKQVIYKMATSPVMAGGTLALVDTDPKVAKTMISIAKKACAETKCGVKVIGGTDRKKVMKGADFLVLSFSEKNAHYRKIDTEITAKHGMLMCSSDTIGPGGIFRAMRELPVALDIAKDAERLCPNAWLINFVNPTTVMGMGLRRYAPKIKSFALCDGNHEPHVTLMYCKSVGLLPMDATAEALTPDFMRDLEFHISGVNHCTWVYNFRYKGKDMLPKLKASLKKGAREEKKNPSEKAKPRFNLNYQVQLMELFDACPTATSHTKEYVPYFQGIGVKPNIPEPIRCFDGDLRQSEMDAAWKETCKYATGEYSAKKFIKNGWPDHATDIIESMWGGLGKPFFINTTNNGAVPNLPDDAFLEMRCDVDMRGPRPQPLPAMPRGIWGLTHQILDVHEMTAEAAVTGDRKLLRRALLCDPLCNNIADADACIADLLEAEKDILPKYWYK
jgi:alpha-galactosidase